MLRLPTKVLTTLAGGAIDDLVADQLTELRSKRLEVLLHPSDMVISGGENQLLFSFDTASVVRNDPARAYVEAAERYGASGYTASAMTCSGWARGIRR